MYQTNRSMAKNLITGLKDVAKQYEKGKTKMVKDFNKSIDYRHRNMIAVLLILEIDT